MRTALLLLLARPGVGSCTARTNYRRRAGAGREVLWQSMHLRFSPVTGWAFGTTPFLMPAHLDEVHGTPVSRYAACRSWNFLFWVALDDAPIAQLGGRSLPQGRP
jgi:hypothetical protein